MTLPSPRLHPDPATDPAPDTGGDWRLVAWLPVVFAVAAIRWARWRLCGLAYRVGDALNEDEYDGPLATPEARAALTASIMRKVEAEAARIEAARYRGGAT